MSRDSKHLSLRSWNGYLLIASLACRSSVMRKSTILRVYSVLDPRIRGLHSSIMQMCPPFEVCDVMVRMTSIQVA